MVKSRPVSGLQRHADADRTLPKPVVTRIAVNGSRCVKKWRGTRVGGDYDYELGLREKRKSL